MSDYVSAEERALIEKAIAGDGDAYGRLMRPYLSRMRHQVGGYFKSEADRDDALQEILLATFRRLRTFQFQSRFSSWLFRCCATGSLEHLQRRVAPHSHLSLDTPRENRHDNDKDAVPLEYLCGLHGVFSDADDPEAQLEAKQQLEAIDTALRKLPEAFRQAFYLREIEQLTYEEIAAAMACKPGTVKSRINRARQAVYDALGIERPHGQ